MTPTIDHDLHHDGDHPATERSTVLMGYVMPSCPTIMELSIFTIEADPRVQQRAALDLDTVAAYTALYQEGVDLGPLVAFTDGKSMFLADGFHRIQAANLAGIEWVSVEVHPATGPDAFRDALFHATKCNLHGKPLSNADKRKRVVTMIQDPEWGRWSDNGIAKHCGVAQSFVSKIRHSLSLNSEISDEEPPSSARLYKDRWGRVHEMETARIGQEAPGPPLPVSPPPVTANGVSGDPDAQEGMSLPVATLAQHEGEVLLTQQSEMEQANGTSSAERPESIFTELEVPVPPAERTYDTAVEFLAAVFGSEVREGILSGAYQLEPYDVEVLAGMVVAGRGYAETMKREWPAADPGAFLQNVARTRYYQSCRERWLDPEYERHAREHRQQEEAKEAARDRRRDLDEARESLERLAHKYGRATVHAEVVLPFDDMLGLEWYAMTRNVMEPIATVLGMEMIDYGTVDECFEDLRKIVDVAVQRLKESGESPAPHPAPLTEQLVPLTVETADTPPAAPEALPAPPPVTSASMINCVDVGTIAEPADLSAQPSLSPIETHLLAYLTSIAPEGCTGKQGAEAIGKLYTSTTRAWSNLVAKGFARKEERKGGALYYSSEPAESANA
jgi:hypothetical protein